MAPDPDSPTRFFPERGTLYPYVKNVQVYICPSDPQAAQVRLSYSMHAWLGYIDGSVVRRFSEVKAPATLVLLTEIEDRHFSAFSACWFAPEIPHVCPDETPYCDNLSRCVEEVACRHSGRSTNALFCDGHVKNFPKGALRCRYTNPNLE